MRALPPSPRARRRSFLASGGIALWNHFRPRLELLEDRRMLACEVLFRDGLLSIQGDDGNNVVDVIVGLRRVTVACDGAPAETFNNVQAIRLDLLGGDDDTTFNAEDAVGAGAIRDTDGDAVPKIIDGFGGGGADTFVIDASAAALLRLDGGEGGDNIHIQFGRLFGAVQVGDRGSEGRDRIQFVGTDFAEKIELDGGNDEAWIAKWEGPRLDGTGGTQVAIESIEIAHEGFELAEVRAGDGNDQIAVVSGREGRSGIAEISLRLFGQGGHDLGSWTKTSGLSVEWDVVEYDGGDGQDQFQLNTSDDAERIDIIGIPDPEIPDPLVRLTDLATGAVTFEATVVGTEAIDVEAGATDEFAADNRRGALGKTFLTFRFATVFTTKIDWSGPGDEGPEESITFVYGKLDVVYFIGGEQASRFAIGPDAERRSLDLAVSDIATGRETFQAQVAGAELVTIKGGDGDDEFHVAGAVPVVLHLFGQAGDDAYKAVANSPRSVVRHARRLDFDGGVGTDEVHVIGTDLAESFEILGAPDPEIPDPLIRVTDLASGKVTADLSIVGAESIAVDAAGGDDRVTMRDDQGPLAHVNWMLITGAGNDKIDAVLQSNPNEFFVEAGLGNDDVSIRFVGIPNLPEPNEPLPVIDVDMGAGVNGLLLDVFGSRASPPIDFAAADIAPSVTLTEVLAAIFISGVGTMAILTLFPLGALEMAQAVQDDRAGHTAETTAAIVLDAANFSADLRTGSTADEILIGLAPRPDSQIKVNLKTGGGDDDVTVSTNEEKDDDDDERGTLASQALATAAVYELSFDLGDGNDRLDLSSVTGAGPLDFSLDVMPGQSFLPEVEDEVLVAFEHGDISHPVVLGTLWNSDAPASKSVERRMSLDVWTVGPTAWLDFGLAGGPGEDILELDWQIRASALLECDVLTGAGNDQVSLKVESAGEELEQKLRIDTGAGDDHVTVNVPQSTRDGLADLIVGADAGAGPHVKVFDGATGAAVDSFFAYDPSFAGGVRVAAGDVNGDGVADIITGAGAGAGPHVKVFDGRSGAEVQSFSAYGVDFTGGVYVAAADINGDGIDDIVTGAGADAAGGHVKVFDGRTGAELRSFFAYGTELAGGVRVAAGDVNGDGQMDIITAAGPGGGPHVKVFDGRSLEELRSFFAYGPSFTGGVFVAAGDVDGDGRADIVTGADAGAPGGHVKVFSGATGAELRSFFAFEPSFSGGVRVAAGDVTGDGRVDLIVGAGPGSAGGHVKVFDGLTLAEVRSFLAFDPSFAGGVFVAAGDVNSAAEVLSLDLDLTIDTGSGSDAVETNLSAFADALLQKVRINTGGGNDTLALGLLPYIEQDNLYQVQVDLGAGNDQANYWVFGTELPPATTSEPLLEAPGRLVIEVLGGLGRDVIGGQVGTSPQGEMLPLALGQASIQVDGGGGNDRIGLDFRDTIFDDENVEAILHGGGGTDQVLARFDLGPASTGKLTAQVFGEAGNDDLGLAIFGDEQLDDLVALLDGGKGRDKCRVTKNVTVVRCEL